MQEVIQLGRGHCHLPCKGKHGVAPQQEIIEESQKIVYKERYEE